MSADDKLTMATRATYAAASVIPGRSLTRSKAPGAFFDVGEGPLYAVKGSGCQIVDTDGKSYIDMLCGLGAISLGYTDMPVSGATVLSLPSPVEGNAARMVLGHVAPWADRVRFTKTGSEATHAALMIARLATGRRAYARLRGSYHGWHSEWREDAPGVFWFNVGDRTLRHQFAECAAVFVEPPRWQTYTREWLISLACEAEKAGAKLVFDEMIYGGRWALGGATEYYGVTPDMACFGKAIGNGASVACVVGFAEDMDRFATDVSGTYSGDVSGLTAVWQTLRTYAEQPVIDTLWRRGQQLQRGLRDVLRHYEVRTDGEPVHQRLVWTDPAQAKRFSAAMARHGVLWHPGCANVMYAHTAADIEAVVVAADASIREVM